MDSEKCQQLRDVITGSRSIFSTELWWAESHWTGCPTCQQEFPQALQTTSAIRFRWREDVRAAIARLSNEFLSKKHALLAGSSFDAEGTYSAQLQNNNEVFAQILAALAMCGRQVAEELDYIAESGDPQFSVYIDTADIFYDDKVYVWRACAEFIKSLPSDISLFTFSAMLVCELILPFHYLLIASSDEPSDPDGDDGGLPADNKAARVAKHLLNSGFHLPNFCKAIESTAAACLQNYLQNTEPLGSDLQSSHRDNASKQRDAAFEEFRKDFSDFVDSMKATQMEQLRLIEKNVQGPSDYEPFVKAKLGEPLFSSLHEATQKQLIYSAYQYETEKDPDDYSPCIWKMMRAYETELVIRVFWPVLTRLLAAGHREYGGNANGKYRLICDGKSVQESLEIGPLSWCLRHDKGVREQVAALGFEVDDVSKDASAVRRSRINVAHEHRWSRNIADDLRRQIFSPDGMFSRLHPATANGAAAAK